MKEIIIRTSEIFSNTNNYSYDDDDISTLGAKEVFEAIMFKDDKFVTWCRLMGNDAIKHINSNVVIRHTITEPGKQLMTFREANIEEIKFVMMELKRLFRNSTVSLDEARHVMLSVLAKQLRDNKLNDILIWTNT